MNKLYCVVNMFDFAQKVYLVNEEGNSVVATSTLEKLPEVICTLCKDYDVNDVVIGTNKDLCEKLKDNTLKHAKTSYSNFNLNIEVM